MAPEEVKRRKEDMARKAESAMFEVCLPPPPPPFLHTHSTQHDTTQQDAWLANQMRKGNSSGVGVAAAKKKATKFHTTGVKANYTYTDGGL